MPETPMSRTPRAGARGLTGGVAALLVAAALGACGGMEAPPTTTTEADSADNVFFGLTHYLTYEGIRQARLEADSAYFYQASQTAELFGVRVTFYATSGAERSTLTSETGTYDWRSGNMIARGDVLAVTPDGRRLTTGELIYNQTRNEIEGPGAFVFVTGEGLRREGEAFTADPDFRNVVATRARGELGRVEIDQ